MDQSKLIEIVRESTRSLPIVAGSSRFNTNYVCKGEYAGYNDYLRSFGFKPHDGKEHPGPDNFEKFNMLLYWCFVDKTIAAKYKEEFHEQVVHYMEPGASKSYVELSVDHGNMSGEEILNLMAVGSVLKEWSFPRDMSRKNSSEENIADFRIYLPYDRIGVI